MDKTIALYMRLSDEDDNLAAHEESNSISHQRKLMLDHIQKLPELKDCNIMEFSDDGYSGADFSRPNFVKMMDLVKAGKIQACWIGFKNMQGDMKNYNVVISQRKRRWLCSISWSTASGTGSQEMYLL